MACYRNEATRLASDHGCDDGILWPMNYGEPGSAEDPRRLDIQRCDECQLYEDDWQAARILDAELPQDSGLVLMHDERGDPYPLAPEFC